MASNPQHEPTMEEILASIRKIISEDSNETQSLEGRANGGASAPGAVEGDVYELNEDDVLEDPQPLAAVAPAAPMQEPARVMQLTPRTESPPTVQPHEEPTVTASVSPAASSDVQAEPQEGFFSDTARKAMHETFARLEPVAEIPNGLEPAPVHAAPAGSSVQDVFEHAIREKIGPIASEFLKSHADEIVERMKPIVREWMDEHFPAILEGAVRGEVERAVRAAATAKPRR